MAVSHFFLAKKHQLSAVITSSCRFILYHTWWYAQTIHTMPSVRVHSISPDISIIVPTRHDVNTFYTARIIIHLFWDLLCTLKTWTVARSTYYISISRLNLTYSAHIHIHVLLLGQLLLRHVCFSYAPRVELPVCTTVNLWSPSSPTRHVFREASTWSRSPVVSSYTKYIW